MEDPCTILNSGIQALRLHTTKSLYTTTAYRSTDFTSLGRRKSRRALLYRISLGLPTMARILGTTIRFRHVMGLEHVWISAIPGRCLPTYRRGLTP